MVGIRCRRWLRNRSGVQALLYTLKSISLLLFQLEEFLLRQVHDISCSISIMDTSLGEDELKLMRLRMFSSWPHKQSQAAQERFMFLKTSFGIGNVQIALL